MDAGTKENVVKTINEKNKVIRIGLAGNPNSGKTTLFNAITGAHQKVGNYAGVTVEKKEGYRKFKDFEIIIYDLPGTYSLTAYSQDEVVARDFILEEKPDLIINVLDATNIERNLYFCLQLQELGVPVVGALNIIDQAEEMGIDIEEELLGELLQLPLVKTIGAKKKGIDLLLKKAVDIYCHGLEKKAAHYVFYGSELEDEIVRMQTVLEKDQNFIASYPSRWFAIKLLEKDQNVLEKLKTHQYFEEVKSEAKRHIEHLEKHFGKDAEIIVSEQRYAYVHGAVAEAVFREDIEKETMTERIDKVLLNRFLGLPIFFLVLWSIFQVTFTLGKYPMELLETFFAFLSNYFSVWLPEGLLRSLVVDGVIAGVGGVFSFIPLIILLFLLISILEDTGYMSRAAFIMDKFLHIFGLHGQSFLPMMLGFGCSVPAIMAVRTLRSAKDRILTILVLPFMSCGAKLPVYVLLAAAFFADRAGNVVMSVYVIGIVLGLITAAVFKRILFKGKSTPFVMELPPYRFPTIRGIMWHVWNKTAHYLRKAGTVILLASVLVWLMTGFPKPATDEKKQQFWAEQYKEAHLNADDEEVAKHISLMQAEENIEYSIAGRIGKGLQFVLEPIGFNWKIGIATITGFAAKEVVVSTLGVLYKVEDVEESGSDNLRTALVKDRSFNPLVAYSLMLFTLINIPCFATLATIRAEIGWKWLGFSVFYNFILAWFVCFFVYRVGILFVG